VLSCAQIVVDSVAAPVRGEFGGAESAPQRQETLASLAGKLKCVACDLLQFRRLVCCSVALRCPLHPFLRGNVALCLPHSSPC
jgi:hypothetical protein